MTDPHTEPSSQGGAPFFQERNSVSIVVRRWFHPDFLLFRSDNVKAGAGVVFQVIPSFASPGIGEKRLFRAGFVL